MPVLDVGIGVGYVAGAAVAITSRWSWEGAMARRFAGRSCASGDDGNISMAGRRHVAARFRLAS